MSSFSYIVSGVYSGLTHHAEESHITQRHSEMEESHITRREVTWQSQWHSVCHIACVEILCISNPKGTAAITWSSFDKLFLTNPMAQLVPYSLCWDSLHLESRRHSGYYMVFFWHFFLTSPMAQLVPYSLCWDSLHLESRRHSDYYMVFFWQTFFWQARWHSLCHIACVLRFSASRIPKAQRLLHGLLLTNFFWQTRWHSLCHIACVEILCISNPEGTAAITWSSFDKLFWQSRWHSLCHIACVEILCISNPNNTATITGSSFDKLLWAIQWGDKDTSRY